ncbi:toxin [Phyllobacterium brassicacearum]|uniref:Toxin n=1 Tax=Phyllobacterium brassicacearum TaxID=314235 RepID=A0A2P7B5D6_9HYPH|nr:toxin [Phyllobacterium brassicacearum]
MTRNPAAPSASSSAAAAGPRSGGGAPDQRPAITLPTGGGAIRGIDEKFRTNPTNGSGTLSVPIAVSPARQAFGPQLTLRYDSGGGSGPFGLGWELSLPSVSRKTEKGVPRYQDGEESDVFILSEAEDLVPVLVSTGTGPARHHENRGVDDTPYLIHRYRPRIEGLFARIERWTNQQTGESHWRSITRDNVTTLYGRTGESRIADPVDPRRIFRWLICESYDDTGNAIVYRYKAEDSANVDPSQVHERNRTPLSRSAGRYIKRIHYGNPTPRRSGENLNERTDWLFEVVFDYGEGHFQRVEAEDERGAGRVDFTIAEQEPWPVRPDPMSSHRAGFEVRTYRLCRRVLMFHHFPEELLTADYLVRATHFDHVESPVHSLVTRVTQSSYLRREDGAYLEHSLPSVDFEYSRAEIQPELREIDRASLENLPVGLNGSRHQWVDLDGEGISGILTDQGRGWFYKANLGEGRFGPQETVTPVPSLAALGRGQQLIDLAGDGQLDLVTLGESASGFYERTDFHLWTNHRAFASVPSVDWRDPNLRFVDLTGDGHADVLVTEDGAFTWYPSLAEDGYGPGVRFRQADNDEAGPRLLFSDATESIYLADMSGDGLTDLVRIRNGSICYWPNLGHGRFGAKITMDRAPWLDPPEQFDQQRIRLADIDGSGITDFLYLHGDRVSIYFNQAGNRWTDAQSIAFPQVDRLSDLTVADLFGNGTACLIWSSSLPGDLRRQMRYIDLMGGGKPHLLVGSRNNLGAETRVRYTASTRFYLEDKAAGRPWVTRLPFPVHVVERVETFDRISRNRFVTRFAYHHGYYDGVEREFRGFALVEQWDTEEFASLQRSDEFPTGDNVDEASHVPPVYTKTWFHTGVHVGNEQVSNFFAGLSDETDLGEYYREPGLADDAAARLLLPDTILPEGLNVEEEREACRALKGATLRQEVYARDGSEREPHPYAVTEQNFTLRVLQRRAANRHAVFLAHPREALTYHYERNPADPRVIHGLTLAVDDYGNTLQSATIAYGRREADPSLPAFEQEQQNRILITCTETSYTNSVEEDDRYRVPLPSEARTQQLTGLSREPGQPRFRFADVREAVESAGRIAYHETPAGSVQSRLLKLTRTLYRGNDLTGPLALGELQSQALPFESYQLAFTPEHLEQVLGDRVTATLLSDEGRYVHFDDDENGWIPSGRVFLSPNEDDGSAEELAFAQEHFFLPQRIRDPFGEISSVVYDAHDLLLLETRDPLGNRVSAGERASDGSLNPRINYRVLQPEVMTDLNGNRSAVAFDILGLVSGTAMMGKMSEALGDSLTGFQPQPTQADVDAVFANPRGPMATQLLGGASSRIVYDVGRFQRFGQPTFAASIVRETHVSELAEGETTDVLVSLAYSDGFGRTIQNKVPAEPGSLAAGGETVDSRWAASGWTIFNNKGKPVRQYEPFFSPDHGFEFGVAAGVSPTLFYDPVGRVVAMLYPNHTWEKTVFDAWRQVSHDVNDTVLMDPADDPDVGGFFRRLPETDYRPTWHALRTDPAHAPAALARWPDARQRQDEADAATKTEAHAATPGILHFDSLGRPCAGIADNGADGQHRTRTEQDIEGNPLRIIDDRGNVVMSYLVQALVAVPGHDMAGRRLFENSRDAGERWVLTDISGKPVRGWNSRGYVLRTLYDPLQRPTHLFVRHEDAAELLAELTRFGESHPDAENLNLRGRIYQVYDGAGVATNHRFDFKGNLLESSRRFAREYRATVDWSALAELTETEEIESAAAELLETEEAFPTRTDFDALNRPVANTTPDNSVHLPTYNEANLLEQLAVQLQGTGSITPVVVNIDYNARGQRERITYATTDGSHVTTAYAYDPDRHRLTRLRTTRHSDGRILQDLIHTHDPIGNITSIRDDSQQTVFFSNAEIDPHTDYTYDALYRLIRVEGREHAVQNNIQQDSADFQTVTGIPFPNSPEALQRYIERYAYDGVGNILSLQHVGGGVERWTRRYQYAADSNRLQATSLPGDPADTFSGTYAYDAHGNMTTIPHLPMMRWDFKDQLQASSRQVMTTGGIPETTYYAYDATGQRVRKVTERQSAVGSTPRRRNERLYLGAFEVFREYNGDGTTVTLERETLHVADGRQRIAQIDTRTQGEDDAPAQDLRFQFGNHLGSVRLELDDLARVLSYEEYHPYGTSAYRAGRSVAETSLKRYRYSGKEKDEETGLYYHEARYYASWLGRWTAADPAGIADGTNLYRYAQNRPSALIDPNGTSSAPSMSEQERAAQIQRQRVQNPPTTPFPDPDDPNDPRNYETFEQFAAGAVGPWTEEGLRGEWELHGEGGEGQQRAIDRAASHERVHQEMAAEITAAQEDQGLYHDYLEWQLENSLRFNENMQQSIQACLANDPTNRHCIYDPNDPAAELEQATINAQQKVGDAVLPGLKARPPRPKALPPARGTKKVAKDARALAEASKQEAAKLAALEKTADALTQRGYTVLVRQGDEGLPDLRIKKIGDAGDLVSAESKRLTRGTQRALHEAIAEGTRSGMEYTVIDATGVLVGESLIRQTFKGFLSRNVPERLAKGSAGAHGRVLVLHGRYELIEFSY